MLAAHSGAAVIQANDVDAMVLNAGYLRRRKCAHDVVDDENVEPGG